MSPLTPCKEEAKGDEVTEEGKMDTADRSRAEKRAGEPLDLKMKECATRQGMQLQKLGQQGNQSSPRASQESLVL